MLAEWCKINYIHHEGQIGFRKQRSTIDTVPRVIYKVQKVWVEEKFAGMLQIDVKGAFDHVSRNYLLCVERFAR